MLEASLHIYSISSGPWPPEAGSHSSLCKNGGEEPSQGFWEPSQRPDSPLSRLSPCFSTARHTLPRPQGLCTYTSLCLGHLPLASCPGPSYTLPSRFLCSLGPALITAMIIYSFIWPLGLSPIVQFLGGKDLLTVSQQVPRQMTFWAERKNTGPAALLASWPLLPAAQAPPPGSPTKLFTKVHRP